MRRKTRRPYLRQFFLNNKINFCLSLLATVIMAVVNLVISWMLQQIMDLIGGETSSLSFLQLIIIFVGVLITIILVGLLRAWAMPRFFSRAMKQYNDFVFENLLKKNISTFTCESTSTYLSAFSNDNASIETNYLEGIFDFIMDALICVGAFVLMFWYNPLLAFIALVLSLVSFLASILTGEKLVVAEKAVSQKNASFLSMLKDSLIGFSVVKSFKSERYILRLFSQNNEEAQNAKAQRNRLMQLLNTIGNAAGLLAQFGVFFAAAYMAIIGWNVTPGMAWVFLQLSGLAVNFLEEAPSLISSRKAAVGLVDKLALSLSKNVPEEGTPIPKRLINGITLSDLSFSHPGGNEVLHNINYHFETGKCYAVVGASGSGKSTLLSLLMASHNTYEGEIFYDKVELRNIQSDSLYELVSLVEQNVFVFNSTLQNNITMFQVFSDSQIYRAEKLSGLLDFVQQKGDNYLCGENGVGLSGGERQRISIARCLLRETPVILMDEATSSLDKETAFRVTESVLGLDGLTRIVVTHSLDETLLRQYDSILVLSHGRIVETGKFEELMKKQGLFYSLVAVSQ